MVVASEERAAGGAEQVAVVMAVSSAVAEGGDLLETLEQIAGAAVRLTSADAAAVILREGELDGGHAIAASAALDRGYADHLNRVHPLEMTEGPSRVAAGDARPVCVEDVLDDPYFASLQRLPIRERYRAMASVPLRAEEAPAMGVLNVYRETPGSWSAREIDLLSLLADHAAIAIRTAHLLEGTRRQVEGLSLLVRSLRAQAHEHANRLHAIHGLLVLGEVEEARRLIATIEEGDHGLYGLVTTRIENATLAGFLLAESAIARERGIELSLDARSHLGELPACLDDLDAVAVLGNLVRNAVDRVAAMPRSRRRVAVRIVQTAAETTFRVRDWGRGAASDPPGEQGRSGIGLALARHVVHRVRGSIELQRRTDGGLVVTAVFAA